MTEQEIRTAIDRARPGIEKYLRIMEQFPNTNISTDRDFKKLFNGFYKIRQKPTEWYNEYYAYMQSQKGQRPTFEVVLKHLYSRLNRCEASFSSKLVATLNPNAPVWDRHVLEYFKISRPSYPRTKIEDSIACYMRLQDEYDKLTASELGNLMISLFCNIVHQYKRITDTKKIDFILWQHRP